MARTARGRALTEQHRLEQVSLGESLRRWIARLFRRTVDYARIDETVEAFAREAAPRIIQYRTLSHYTSLDYLHTFSQVEDEQHAPVYEAPDPYDEGDAYRELVDTARGVLKAVSRKGYGTADAMEAGERAVAGKATKLAADGGRRVIEEDVKRGHGPIGYARVVDADPCPFCAMLASRGVSYTGLMGEGEGLYRSDSFVESNSQFEGGGDFKVHDLCECTLEPVYKVDGRLRLPGNGDALAREWAEVASGQENPMAAWRRWRESGTLPEDYDGPLEGTRRPAPVRGQATGRKKRPTPQKASERRGTVKKAAEWTAQDYLDHADDLQRRLAGVEAEIADLRSTGQGDHDIPVVALEEQRRALLSRIERYRAAAMKL